MGRDEQKEEREVLESIFPDEINDESDTEYRISIKLDVASEEDKNEEEDEDDKSPILVLRISYPPNYPDVAPDLDLAAPPNAPKYPNLDIRDDKARLISTLGPTIEENLGMAMVFSLVSTLKDAAETLIQERLDEQAAAREVIRARAEEEENRKFVGEAVTRESFLKWRDEFKKEQEDEERRLAEEKELEDKKKRGGAKEERKLTGRELFEGGLAGRAGEEEDDDADEIAETLEKVKVDP